MTDADGYLVYPDATPANPDGLPLFRELVIFCPNPDEPSELLEITVPDDTSEVPTDRALLTIAIDAIKSDEDATRVELTDLLRVGAVTELAHDAEGRNRAAIRFEVEYRPSEAEWTQFQAGTLAWNAIQWPQSIYGNDSGLRQVWLRTELQLNLKEDESEDVSVEEFTSPFFGSAAVNYRMRKSPPS